MWVGCEMGIGVVPCGHCAIDSLTANHQSRLEKPRTSKSRSCVHASYLACLLARSLCVCVCVSLSLSLFLSLSLSHSLSLSFALVRFILSLPLFMDCGQLTVQR